MKRFETRNGNRLVVTYQDGPNYFYSVLCRQEGSETIVTRTRGEHKTKNGAINWAKKVLER